MSMTVTAVFDGEVLRPDTPLDLEPNARYVVTIEHDRAAGAHGGAWEVLDHLAGTIDAPDDWSVEHDHYLYGIPKRRAEE